MNFPYFIARRYFFSKKKKNFINVIAIISMAVVMIGTAALIIVLSVFNGMEDLLRSIYGSFDAPLQVVPKEGKSFVMDKALSDKILAIEGITEITEVIEKNVLVKYDQSQMIARVKGLSENFISQGRMKDAIRDGELSFWRGETPLAILGYGIRSKLRVNVRNDFYPLQMHYPKDLKPGRLNPYDFLSRANIMPGGIFALEQQYDDNYIFVPLSFAEKLFQYKNRRTALELALADGADIAYIQSQLEAGIGDKFNILDADQQHAELYRILKIEKLFVFIAFSLIVALASINIFFSISMLVIEKKADISILFAMGTTKKTIRKIFYSEGAIIAFVGAGSGLLLGFIVAWAQQTFGFVSMGVSSSVSQAYPVKIILMDFVYTAVCIVLITFLASVHPALRAAKQFSLKMQ